VICEPFGPSASALMSAGTLLRTGGVVSWTVTAKLLLPVFPCASVAWQLTFVVPSGNVLPEEGEQLAARGPSTRSFPEAEKLTAAPEGPVASAVIGEGTLTSGGVVSRTVTLKPSGAEVLPCESVAVQNTVEIVMGKVLPEAGEQSGVTGPSTRSLAEAEKLTVAPEGPVASVTIGPGRLMTGGVVSFTVTSNDALPVLLCWSVALHVTLVVPSGKVLPEAGAQEAGTLPSTMSVADAEPNVTTAPEGPVASAAAGAEGGVTVGGVVSVTVTVNCMLAGSLFESVAVHVTVVLSTAKVLPEAGEQPTVVGSSGDGEVVGVEKVTTAPDEDVASVGSGGV
jgi:hypothetical protein